MKNYCDFSRIVAVSRYLLCIALLLLTACKSVSLINETKQWHDAGEYSKVADIDIECSSSDDGCNQLYLLKGDACFRLAKNATANDVKEKQYTCATNNIFNGIDMTTSWSDVNTSREQFYENGLEAARLRADFSNGQEYELVLAKRSQEYLRIAPNSAGAQYYSDRSNYFLMTQQPSNCAGWRQLDAKVKGDAQRFSSDAKFGTALATLQRFAASHIERNCG